MILFPVVHCVLFGSMLVMTPIPAILLLGSASCMKMARAGDPHYQTSNSSRFPIALS